MGKHSFEIIYDSLTNKGERKVNEDSLGVVITNDTRAFLVCDGLGGHGHGDEASSFVVENMKLCLQKHMSVEDSIMYSQRALLQKQEEEGKEASMKTTLTCLTLKDGSAQFAHVGDSRIYLFEKGKYRQRTQDHSVPQMLVSSGAIREKDIRHHEDRSRLLRVMGTEWSEPKYQIVSGITLTGKSSFLLCSDGFWELIEEKEMSALLKKSATPGEWLRRMEEIILANGKGTNMDNYTAIAVFVR